MLPPSKPAASRPWARAVAWAVVLLAGGSLLAQQPRLPKARDEFTLKVKVDLVVLHTTVVTKGGQLVTEMRAENFRVLEDGQPQELAVFRNEDVPVTVGLVLDNSASMRENRSKMMAGSLTFVDASNPLDETFVVNFNDDYYLDLQGKDFTNDIDELKEALERADTRGGTAFYDAVRASLEHLRRGTRQKHVLLIITDGVDHVSYSDFETALHDARQAEAALYLVSLPCSEERRDCRRAKREMRKLAQATGGMVYFPKSVHQVEEICRKIARDIRNQYVLGYYPTNEARDGSFRRVQVEVIPPKGYKNLIARTRAGYYAPSSQPAGSQ
ncbi:MAG: VWA domain-containing protein [Terriglobia bacterium]